MTLVLQLNSKRLIRATPDLAIKEEENGYGIWQRYENDFGDFWNRVETVREEDVAVVL